MPLRRPGTGTLYCAYEPRVANAYSGVPGCPNLPAQTQCHKCGDDGQNEPGGPLRQRKMPPGDRKARRRRSVRVMRQGDLRAGHPDIARRCGSSRCGCRDPRRPACRRQAAPSDTCAARAGNDHGVRRGWIACGRGRRGAVAPRLAHPHPGSAPDAKDGVRRHPHHYCRQPSTPAWSSWRAWRVSACTLSACSTAPAWA